MDRRGGNGGGNGNGGMRDYVDPWAHNGNNGSSPLMGGGPLNSFGMGNGNGNGMASLGNLGNTGPNNQNNGGGFGGNNGGMDMDKTSTQVTIPKDVSWKFDESVW